MLSVHWIIFLAAFLVCQSSYADVYFFPEKDVHVSLGFQSLDYSIDLADDETNKHLNYKPNLQGLVTPRVSYKKIWGLSWGFKTENDQGENRLFGETDYTDIRFDFAFNQLTVNTFYSQYRGFYIDDSAAVDPSLTKDDPRILAPDMYSRIMGGVVTWVEEPSTFSMPSLIDQSERQEKRGGSILLGLSFTEVTIENEQGLIHPAVRSEYDILANMSAARFRVLNLKAGYGWSYPFMKKWFVGGLGQAGFGFLYKELEFLDGANDNGWDPALRGELLIATGYNGDTFFSSLKVDAMADFLMISGSSSRIVPALASVSLTFGVHL